MNCTCTHSLEDHVITGSCSVKCKKCICRTFNIKSVATQANPLKRLKFKIIKNDGEDLQNK